MKYRLALDMGSTSLGWAMVQLNGQGAPCAVIRAGVRIFSDGRNPKDGSSLAVTRREARAMRRRRDRLLKRKARMMQSLQSLGFFPGDEAARKALELLNPYALRAKGLDQALTPAEFARALFHINQRRGFMSNRKTDKSDSDSGALKTAISSLRTAIDPSGAQGKARTVGELLYRRMTDLSKRQEERTVRARYRQERVTRDDGKTRIDKSYDLYIDRAMILSEFETLWAKQAELNPSVFNPAARQELHSRLTHQRPLKPVRPGRCTLIPDEERAPLALPSQQRFRIYQEVGNLRILGEHLNDFELTKEQRDSLVAALERGNKSFKTAIPKLLGLPGTVRFNLADTKRTELKGNTSSQILGRKDLFGEAWHGFDEAKQDAIVMRLVQEESEAALVAWLQAETGVDEPRAERVANASLPEGYGSLSAKALGLILPELRKAVVSYADAAKAAGFHHSRLSDNTEVSGRTFKLEQIDPSTGEIKLFHVFHELPYYGEFLQRHVGFADPKASPEDLAEKRFGRIANPTVHIGLNQVRKVVNALIQRYGHPSEVVVEVARELKQNQDERKEQSEHQAKNQRRNERLRAQAAGLLQCAPERVRHADVERLILWEELSDDVADRRCPYSGVQISAEMVLREQVEVEHILPFSRTLDDSKNNKTLAMRWANRIKGDRTPWEARADFAAQGWDYAGIQRRAEQMPNKGKRYRFGEAGYQQWLKGADQDGKGFLARALNDTRYMSRVAREYLSLICPQGTRVIPGQMTAMLRKNFGLNGILGLDGEKNRNDHRHHAVDACVIGVTDQGLLKRFASASADARKQQLDRLVENMPDPWPSYREQVRRAIGDQQTIPVHVSHKPDHGHEGAMHNDTAYALLGAGRVAVRKVVDGVRTREETALKVIEFSSAKALHRHGQLPDGSPRPYKGYKGDSNYCIEIVRGDSDKGKWAWEIISTFDAYQAARKHGVKRLHDARLSLSGKPLVMRLIIGDYLRAQFKDTTRLLVVKKIKSNGGIFVAQANESNVRQREDEKDPTLIYGSFTAGTLQKARGRRVTVSPIGELRDPGFKE